MYALALSTLPGFRLAGIIARGSQRSVNLAEKMGVPLYKTPDEVRSPVDVACVAVGGNAAEELVLAFLRRGIHVVAEHPVGPASMKTAIGTARRTGACYHVNAHVAPRTSLEEALAGIWCDVLELKQVGVHDNFFDLGGHSLLALRVQARTESQLARKVPLTAFLQTPTIAEIAALLQDVTAAVDGRQWMTSASPGSQPRLFCFHFLNIARSLDKHLAPRWPVRFIESPLTEELRAWKEHHQVTISLEALAARCRNAVLQVQPRGPYYLLGYCFAGVLAFEVASQLTRLGESVAFLGLLDATYGPGGKPLARPWTTRWTYHARRVSQDGVAYLGPKVRYQFRALKRDLLPHARRLVRVALGKAESQAMLLHSGRFVTAMLARYRGAPYPGDAVLFNSARSSPFTSRAEYSQTNGWEAVIRGGVQLEEVDCDHTDIVFEPYLGEVARRLERYLSQPGNAPIITGKAVPADRRPGI
jgi:thioesterase domain-containing protein